MKLASGKGIETMGGFLILHTQSSPCIQHVVAMFYVDDGVQEGCVVSNIIWSGGRVVAMESLTGPLGILLPTYLQGVPISLHVPIAIEMGFHSADMTQPSWG